MTIQGGEPAGWRPEEDLDRVLIEADALQARVCELADQITADYQGRRLVLVGVLKGAVMFLIDLARHINLPMELDFMATSSYGDSSESSGVVRILKDLDAPIEGKDILIVEDIVDTGLTLRYVIENLATRRPRSIRVCSLLVKERARSAEVPVDYAGFRIPDQFVVGYGLDHAERYRNLPYIGVLKPELYR